MSHCHLRPFLFKNFQQGLNVHLQLNWTVVFLSVEAALNSKKGAFLEKESWNQLSVLFLRNGQGIEYIESS